MSRPSHLLLSAAVLACSVTLIGCGTIYDETYSPSRNRFVPDPPTTITTTTEVSGIPAGDTTPSSSGSSTAPILLPPPAPMPDAAPAGDIMSPAF